MGGGTSNAICLVKHLTRNKINKNLLKVLSKRIGSDVRIFLYHQGFISNLKKIYGFQKKYSLYLLLVYPSIKCSTKYIYSKVRKFLKNQPWHIDLSKELKRQNFYFDHAHLSAKGNQILSLKIIQNQKFQKAIQK